MRRVIFVVVASVLLSVALIAPASVLGAPMEVKLHPKAPVTVAVGAPIKAKINVRETFSSISVVCIEFQFEGDLLDPGEFLDMDFGPALGGFGFENVGSTPQGARTICTEQPELLAAFLDGRQDFEIRMESGSVTISSITVSIVGS
jgi:hypothetical protein